MRLHGVREISKKFEEIREGRTAEYIEYFTAHSPRAEFVIGLRKFLKIVLRTCPKIASLNLLRVLSLRHPAVLPGPHVTKARGGRHLRAAGDPPPGHPHEIYNEKFSDKF